MSAVIGALRGLLSLDSAAFEKGAKRSKASMGDLERRMVRMGSKIEGVGRRMTLGLTLPMAGMAAVAVKSSLRIIDTQAKMAQSLGTTVKSMQVLSRAADLSGVSIGEVEQATLQLTKRLSQAAAGTGPAVKALDRLHLSSEALQKLPLDERLASIQQAMSNYVPVAERAAVASDLFGSRAGLIFSRIDSNALRIASEDVTRFGVAISEVDADQIEIANDAISRLGLVGRGAANQLTVALAPSLQSIADKAASVAEWFSNLSDRTKRITSVTLSLTAALGPVAIGLGLALKLAAPLGRVLLAMVSPIGLVVVGFTALAAAGVYLSNTASDSAKFSAAHEIAMDNVTIAMGDQIRATARLSDALKKGGPITLAAIEAKMAEAKAARAVTDELVRARQEKELEALGYYQVLKSMADYREQLDAIYATSTQVLEQIPARLRDQYIEVEEGLAAAIVQQQKLLAGVRAQAHLTDEERASQQLNQEILVDLQRRWNELNGITAENVSLTDRGVVAAGSLASGLGAAAGQASALKSYLSGLPGALAGAQANIAGLRAGMSVLAGGGGEAAANVAKFRAELVASLPALDQMHDGQRRNVEAGINQQVRLYEENQRLSGEYRTQISALNKVSSAGGAASKSALSSLQKEIRQRRALVGFTDDQRKKLEAVRAVQQKLGKEGAGLSKAQIEGLADQLVELDNTEAALSRIQDMQRQWSEQITRTAFEGGSLTDTITGMLRDIAYQFAHSQIVLPIIASVTGILGLDQLIGGGVSQAIAGGAGGGGGLLNGLLGNVGGGLLGGGGFLSGIGSGLGGVLSGGGLGSSFANLGGLVSGISGGLGAIGAALPAIGLVLGGIYALSKAFSRKYAGTAIRGSFGATGFDGDQFDFHKGGMFRSNRAYHRPLATELEAMLDQTMQGVTSGLTNMAGALGLSADAIENFSGVQFTLWTNGKDAEQIQQELQDHIAATADVMASLILGTDEFTRVGETAAETLSRLSSGLTAVNDVADLLGHQSFNVSLSAADMASDLVDQFGSAEAMASAANSYFGAFYSQGERTETILRRLRERFEDIGVAMPESRVGFRMLVESIDLTSASGRELYAQLLQLSGAMNDALPAIGMFTASMSGLLNEVGGEIGAQIQGALGLASDAKAAASLWYRTATTLRNFLSDLLSSDLTAASSSQAEAIHRNRFQTAFDMARGGDVDAAQDIPALARNYLRSLREGASSALEYRRAAAQVQGQINFLSGIAELEGANDEVLTGLYEQQIEVLTGLARFLQLEGLTSEQVSDLTQGVQDLAADWDGTVASFQTSLGALEAAIVNAEAFSYDDLVGSLDVAVSLSDSAPVWLRRLVDRADTGIRTVLDFVIRRNDLTAADRWIATNALSEHVATLDFVLGDDLDDETRRLALTTDVNIRRNILLVLSQDLDFDTRLMVLTSSATLSRTMNLALGGDLDPETRLMALTNFAILTRSVNLALSEDLDPDTRLMVLTSSAIITRTVDLALGEDLDPDTRLMVLTSSATLSRTVNLSLGEDLDPDTRLMVLTNSAIISRVINVVLGEDVDADTRALVLTNSATLSRTLHLALGDDLDPATRLMVLTNSETLSRMINVVLGDDLDPDTRLMVLTASSVLTRTIDMVLTGSGATTIGQLTALQDLLGSGSGLITFDGGLSFTLDSAFSTLFNGVTSSTQGLSSAMGVLGGLLTDLRSAVMAETQQRLNAQALAGLQLQGRDIAASLADRSTAQSLVGQVEALEASTGVSLRRSGGRDADLRVSSQSGRILYSADWATYGAGSNIGAFRQGFWNEGGLEDQIRDYNSAYSQRARELEAIRAQIRNMGVVPGFAAGGDFAGGVRIVGERGWEIEQTGPSHIHSHSDSVAMLDNRPVVEALKDVARKLDRLERSQIMLQQRQELHAKKTAEILEGWNDDGLPKEFVE